MIRKDQESSRSQQTLLHKWFEIGKLPRSLQKIAFIYIGINLLFGFGFHMTDTFLTLFLLEKYSWTNVSIVFAIQIATQLVFDYPTGALGDFIGQRIVLVSAFALKILSIVFLLVPGEFYLLIVYGVLAGLGNSQLSGALDSWFDSNYKNLSADIDSERKIYSHFTAKLYSTYLAVAAIACLISGTIGMTISREVLFIIEIFVYLIILVMIIRFITPIQNCNQEFGTEKSPLAQYFATFKNGLRFAFSKIHFACFFIGYAIFNGFMNGVWTNLILFPYYNSYAGTDFLTGLFRWIVLTIDIFLVLLLKKIPANSKKPRRGYLTSLISIPISLAVLMGYYLLFPPAIPITTWGFIRLLFVDFTLAIPYRLTFLFFAKIMIDLIPNEIRNSIYSLLPTLSLMINVPAALLGGNILDSYGIPHTILLVILFSLVGILLQALGLLSQRKQSSTISTT